MNVTIFIIIWACFWSIYLIATHLIDKRATKARLDQMVKQKIEGEKNGTV